MLLRRFSIVCLIVALFGMGLAILVAEASRPTSDWRENRPFACLSKTGPCTGRQR